MKKLRKIVLTLIVLTLFLNIPVSSYSGIIDTGIYITKCNLFVDADQIFGPNFLYVNEQGYLRELYMSEDGKIILYTNDLRQPTTPTPTILKPRIRPSLSK